MADDDDDEAFGDFTFASSSSLPHPPPQINVITSSSNQYDAEDDDDWGDFVTPDSANRRQGSDMKSGDLVVTDRFVPDRVEEEKKGVVRARGALPLSIFGEEEGEEEEKGSGGGGFGVGGGQVFRGKSGDLGRKGSDVSGLGISDLLASLYNQGGGSGEGGGGKVKGGDFVDLKENGLKNGFDVLDSRSNGYVNGFSSNAADDDVKRMESNESGFSFGIMNSDSDGFSSSARAFNQGVVSRVENGRRTKSDESAFNFLMTSSGSDVFSFSGRPNNAVACVKADNGWSETMYALDFNLSMSELGNDLGNIGSNTDVNGSKLDSKSLSTEDNDDDDDGWEFQGNTNVTKEQEDGMQWEITGASIMNNGPKLDPYKSESDPNESHMNTSKEDETQGKWEFLDFAAPSAKDESNELWDFQGNSVPTAKGNSDGVLDFQVVAVPTAIDEHNSEFGYVRNSNTSAEEENDGGWEFHVAPVDQNPKLQWNMGVQGFGAQEATLRSDSQVAGSNLGAANDSVSEGSQYDGEIQSTSAALNGSLDGEDSYWDFKDSFPETNLENKVNKADGGQQGALPPSLFSDVPLDSSDTLNQDDFSFNPSQSHTNGFKFKDSSASLSDLILNLYNQSEEKYSEEPPQQAVANSSDANQTMNNSSLSNDEDDFDDAWDFKDASQSIVTDDQNSYQVHHSSSYTASNMGNLVDFYCKLKDQSSLAAICHLSILKEAKSRYGHAKNSEVEALDEKIQDALKELHRAHIVLEDAPENCTPDKCLMELHHVLSEPKFQMVDSVYGLSRRLSAAEKDFKSAIELVEHAALILGVLSMGSADQLSCYISTWTEILFVCAQELQHGASIWQRAVEKSVHSQILSRTKGKKFVCALGEIFRAVLILEVSTKAYRPWILSNSSDIDSIFALLNECSTLWSSSGLNDALKCVSDLDSESAGEVRALIESINQIREFDVPGSLRQQDSVCGLSLLNEAIIPAVKLVVWNEEQYFLPLANLWANLISSDPPNLPRIHVG